MKDKKVLAAAAVMLVMVITLVFCGMNGEDVPNDQTRAETTQEENAQEEITQKESAQKESAQETLESAPEESTELPKAEGVGELPGDKEAVTASGADAETTEAETTEAETSTEVEEPTVVETSTEVEEPTATETSTEVEEPTAAETSTEVEEPTVAETSTETEKSTETEETTETEDENSPCCEYAVYLALSPAEQENYMNTFNSVMDFIAWSKAAAEKHEEHREVIEVEGGDLNIGDFVGQ